MKKILLIACLFISANTWAQTNETRSYKDMMYDNSVNFYDVVKAAEEHFSKIDKNAKGSGWKPYQRWRVNNEYKYYPSGDRSQVDPMFAEKEFKKFLEQNSNVQNKLFPGGWQEVGPVLIDSITGHYAAGLGRIEDVYINPANTNIMYLGSRSGGFWRTTNGGTSWSNTTDFLLASGVNAITASPTNSDSVLINVQNARNNYTHGIYRSTDGGQTWTLSNFNPASVGQGGLGSSFRIYEIAYHPRVADLIFICTNDGIYRSDDNLQTWTKLYNNSSVTDMAFHPTADSIIYIYNTLTANRNHVMVSRDLGTSYTQSDILTGNNNTTSLEISTSPDCQNCLFAATTNGVWKSLDTGNNFVFMENPSQSCRGFAVSDVDTAIMIYGYVDLMQSTNGGDTFTRVTRWSLGNTNGSGNGHQVSYQTSTNYIHADVRNAKCVNGDFYVTTDGFLCKSTDNGITWQKLSNEMGIRENYRLGASQSNHYKIVVGSQDNGTSFSYEDGWVELYGADGMEAIVHPLNEEWFMGSVQYGNRRRTQNNGKSTGGASPSGSSNADWIAPLAFDPNDHMVIYDFRSSVYRSDDFAENHVNIGSPTVGGNIKVAEIAQNNSDIMLVARNALIKKSSDAGSTWNVLNNGLPNATIQDVAFDPKDDDNIFIVYGSYQDDSAKVFQSTNGGSTWNNITYNLNNMPIRSVVVDRQGHIYLGAEIGVFTKPMNATNWTLYNTDLPNMAVLELEVNDGSNTLKAATWGRGVWEYNTVGRKDYPAIVHTSITSPPTLDKPKKGVDQIVTSRISYDNALSAVYLEWSTGAPTFGNVISMTNTVDSTWKSTAPLPDVPVGTKVFFKVFAVGNNGDTTETYKFMYTQQPFAYCAATGHDNDGNLHITDVVMETINNSTGNNAYTLYNTPIPTIYADTSYSIDVSANTGWSENDFGAWIDFNHDAEFTPDENILWSIGGGGNANNVFTVPNAVREDTVVMRVRLSYWGADPRPCGTQFGEVEDYLVALKTNGIAIGIEPIVSETDGITIYPNPTNGILNFDFEKNYEYEYTLQSQIGQLIKKGIINKANNTINISEHASGMYILQIGQHAFKIIKRD